MIFIIGILCAVVGLLAGYLIGAGKAKGDWQTHTQELLDARQKACDDMIAAQDKRHAEAFSAQQAKFDETIAKVSAQMRADTADMLKKRQ